MSSAGGQTDEALWNQIAPVFSNWAFMRPRFGGSMGVASRAGPNRMRRLTSSKSASRLKPLVSGLSPRDLARLIVRSDINLDQANAALRLTLVANISVPIGTVVLINQMAPGYIADVFAETPGIAIAVPVALALTILFGVIWYAYAGVAAARDLNHLLRLSYASVAANPFPADDEDGDAFSEAVDIA